jgi:uncharacterized membrane protein YpjA
VEHVSATFRHADQVPENLKPVVVHRRFRPDGTHMGIIEPWVDVNDHPDEFYRKFVKTTVLVTERSDCFFASPLPFFVLLELP